MRDDQADPPQPGAPIYAKLDQMREQAEIARETDDDLRKARDSGYLSAVAELRRWLEEDESHASARADWERHAREREERGPWSRVEAYFLAREGLPVLAQRLHDEGLIFAVNVLVLHPAGLALGVQGTGVDREAMRMAEVKYLTLQATDDPEGVEYGDEAAVVERNVAKLRDAGHHELAAAAQAAIDARSSS